MRVRAISLFTIPALILAVLFSTTGSDGLAQDKGDTKKAKGMLPAGWKNLKLTDKQQNEVHAVMGAYKIKIKALQEQIKALKDEEHREMVKLLTEDQKKQLAAVIGLNPADKKDDKKSDPPSEKK